MAKEFIERLSDMQDARLRGKTAYTVLHMYAQGWCKNLLRANSEEGGSVTGSPRGADQRAWVSLRLQHGGIAFGGFP